MSALRLALSKAPLVWFMVERTHAIIVCCSAGHPSMLQHRVHADGSLHAPEGKAASLHCGRCKESLPLHLDEWTHGEWTGPYEEIGRNPEICARCGKQSSYLSGWGTWSQPGIICEECGKQVYPKNGGSPPETSEGADNG